MSARDNPAKRQTAPAITLAGRPRRRTPRWGPQTNAPRTRDGSGRSYPTSPTRSSNAVARSSSSLASSLRGRRRFARLWKKLASYPALLKPLRSGDRRIPLGAEPAHSRNPNFASSVLPPGAAAPRCTEPAYDGQSYALFTVNATACVAQLWPRAYIRTSPSPQGLTARHTRYSLP